MYSSNIIYSSIIIYSYTQYTCIIDCPVRSHFGSSRSAADDRTGFLEVTTGFAGFAGFAVSVDRTCRPWAPGTNAGR